MTGMRNSPLDAMHEAANLLKKTATWFQPKQLAIAYKYDSYDEYCKGVDKFRRDPLFLGRSPVSRQVSGDMKEAQIFELMGVEVAFVWDQNE